MVKTINILSIIDVETILANNLPVGTVTNPTSLGSYGTSDIYTYLVFSSRR